MKLAIVLIKFIMLFAQHIFWSITINLVLARYREPSGSVVECLTQGERSGSVVECLT